MFCPRCEDEFVPTVETCPDCEVGLVPELPPKPEPERRDLDLVPLTSGDPMFVEVVASALSEAGIDSMKKGDLVQNLFGAGQVGVGFNLVTGPVELHVDRGDLERARQLLDELAEQPSESAESEG